VNREQPIAARSPIPVPAPFARVHDVIAGLTQLENAFVAAKDRRGVFVTAYLVITRTIQEWIDRELFLQNEMIACYVVAFANAYRQALAHYEAGERLAIPKAWQQSFDASHAGDASIIQDLLLGINAHINHDLPYAVLQGGLNVHCDRCHHDHTRINDSLRLATPLVRQRIAAIHRRGLHITNWIFGRTIDEAVAYTFQRARQNSWALAKALDAARRADQKACLGDMINDRAASAGRTILAHRYAPAKCLASLYEVEDAAHVHHGLYAFGHQ
jgi:hypothetical protein